METIQTGVREDKAHSLDDLLLWAKDHNAYLHPLVELWQDPYRGWAFKVLPAELWLKQEQNTRAEEQDLIAQCRAQHVIPPGTTVVKCPYHLSLSYLNAIEASDSFSLHHSPQFPAIFLGSMGAQAPSVVSNFFLIQQYLLGAESFWFPYIRHLPQPEEPQRLGTPLWWSENDLEYLSGTNIEPAVREQRELWKRQWADGLKLLEEAKFPGRESYSYSLYQWAATIFGSRSFRASLTIPVGLIENCTEVDNSAIREHIQKDDFSLLFPLLDIGNHNGIKKVEWLENAHQRNFELRTLHETPQDAQIYNFYGNKSNTELLMAYGFILPDPELDTVNLMVRAPEKVLTLWRKFTCYLPGDRSAPAAAERMFAVRRASNVLHNQLPGSSGLPPEGISFIDFRPFSHGLVDIMTIMSANEQESRYLEENFTACLENDPSPFAGPLARATVQVLSVLRIKLEQELQRIEVSGAGFAAPGNDNQRLGLEFRNRQKAVLEAALNPITLRLKYLFTFSSLWDVDTDQPHGSQRLENSGRFEAMYSCLEAVSLECAYGWLSTSYPSISRWIEEQISLDQEEALPLDWASLAEENWEHTYLTLWIFILLAIWAKDPTFARDHPILAIWLHEMNRIYIRLKQGQGSSWHGDTQEKETVDNMVEELYSCPDIKIQEQRPWLRKDGEAGMPNSEVITSLRDLASFIATEETVRAKYTMKSGPRAGEEIEQSVLILIKGKTSAAVSTGTPHGLSDPVWPGWSMLPPE